jgi:flagellar motor switch protein FliN/FliY
MTPDAALMRLIESTSAAITGVLETFAPGAVGPVATAFGGAGENAFAGFPAPAIVSDVRYVDGVTGGNVFAIGTLGARRLAAAMMGQDPADIVDGPVDELELSAVSEATNQMLAAAAGAISSVLGEEIEISVPHTRPVEDLGEALDGHGVVSHTVSASFTLHGEPCRIVQLVPNAFVVRMTRALDDLGTLADEIGPAHDPLAIAGAVEQTLRGISVRLSAELGRTRLAAREVVGLPPGAVVELDRGADEPIDICVNGAPFATGRLVLADGAWAVRIDAIASPTTTPTPQKGR